MGIDEQIRLFEELCVEIRARLDAVASLAPDQRLAIIDDLRAAVDDLRRLMNGMPVDHPGRSLVMATLQSPALREITSESAN